MRMNSNAVAECVCEVLLPGYSNVPDEMNWLTRRLFHLIGAICKNI